MCLDLQVFVSRFCRSSTSSKHEPVLDKHNHGMWAQDMNTTLKSKVLSQFTKTVIPNPRDEHEKLMVNGKKD
jgi:hypothetical protein